MAASLRNLLEGVAVDGLARPQLMVDRERFTNLADGTWLQPEPLLQLGLTNAEIGSPLAFGVGTVAKKTGCFVAGTEVFVTNGSIAIEDVEVGSNVVSAAATDGGDERWVEVEDAPVEESGGWAPRGCNRVTAWSPE
ncbi:MAG: hypothetical protein AAGA48_04095 [Myxococcota bacterium]